MKRPTAFFFFSFLRPTAVALIASAGISIAILALFGTGGFTSLAAIDIVSLICFGAALFLLRKFKVSPILIIFGAGIAGAAIKLAFNLP